MINCPRCNKPFEEKQDWGIKKYCSQACANTKPVSDESKEKISKSLSGRKTTRSQDPASREQWLSRLRETRLKKYQDTPFDKLGGDNRRRRVLEEQDYKCNRCGINEWLGEVLSLELEHKDGNHGNNKRENLEALCPNCHSLTPTWRGRNKKQKALNSNG